jgi:Tfp pilus assembly protein PilF
MVTLLIVAILALTWMKGINYPRAAVLVGNALEYSRQGDLPSTLAAIDKAIELAPDVPVYYNWRASVYKAYRLDPAAPRFEPCSFQTDLSYEICLASLAHESNQAGSDKRPFYYRSRIKLADSAFNLLLDDEAIRHYQETLNLVPSSWALRDNLASAFIQQGKPEEALALLEESLAITNYTDPSLNALVLRASAYLDLGQPQESVDDLNRALRISPTNVRVHASLAVVYTSVGQDLKAREHGDMAVRFGGDRAALDRAMEAMRQRK